MLIGDFNAEEPEPCLSQFIFEINAKKIVKGPTCCKSLSNSSCIVSSNFQKYQDNINGVVGF